MTSTTIAFWNAQYGYYCGGILFDVSWGLYRHLNFILSHYLSSEFS